MLRRLPVFNYMKSKYRDFTMPPEVPCSSIHYNTSRSLCTTAGSRMLSQVQSLFPQLLNTPGLFSLANVFLCFYSHNQHNEKESKTLDQTWLWAIKYDLTFDTIPLFCQEPVDGRQHCVCVYIRAPMCMCCLACGTSRQAETE